MGFTTELRKIKKNHSLMVSMGLHLALILAVIFWASNMIEPIALSTQMTPSLQAEVLSESSAENFEKPIEQPIQKSIEKPVIQPTPLKETIPIIQEKPKHPKIKPKPKPKPVVHSENHSESHFVKTPVKTQPKKITAQEIKALQNEALANLKNAQQQAQIQNQIAAQNQAKYLTERDQYIALLTQMIRSHWINQYQDQNLQVSLKIQQDAQGNVTNVSIAQSSGSDAFDRSAMMAIQKSSPLPLPQDAQLVGDTREMTLAFS